MQGNNTCVAVDSGLSYDASWEVLRGGGLGPCG